MPIHIMMTGETADELRDEIAQLFSFSASAGAHGAMPAPAAPAPVPPPILPPEPSKLDGSPAAQERRKRRTKAEMEAARAAEAAPVAPPPAFDPPPAEPQQAAEPIALNPVPMDSAGTVAATKEPAEAELREAARSALQSVVSRAQTGATTDDEKRQQGIAAGMAVLGKFGAKRLPELRPDQLQSFIDACTA